MKHLNVGTIGHINHGKSALTAAMLALILGAGQQVAVMPSRRRELEPGYDMNDMLDLGGRDQRKAARKAKLRAAGSRAFTGARA